MGVPHHAGVSVERGSRRIARTAGAGVVRLVGSLPDRLVVALFCLGLSVSVAVLAEEFRSAVVLPATAVLIVLTWRLTPPAPSRSGHAAVGALAAVAAAGAWVVVNARHVAEYLIVTRDPGFLTLEGLWLSRNASPAIPVSEAARAVAESQPDTITTPASFLDVGGVLHAQGAKLLPALLGVAGRAGGDEAALTANVVIGGIALLAVYAFARRLVGPWWGLLPLVALGASIPMVAFSRAAFTEPLALALAFIFGGLSIAWAAVHRRALLPYLLAGALIGAASLSRIDGAAVVIGLVLGLGLAAAAAVVPRRRHDLRRGLLLALAGAGAMVVLGYLDLYVHSREYLQNLAGEFRLLVMALLAATAVMLVLSVGPWWGPLRRALLRRRRALAWVAAGLVVAAGVVLVSRPLWMSGHHFVEGSAYAVAVAALQEREGLPVDGTRTYDEWSLIWVAWYYGWPFVGLGVAGLAVSAWRAVRRRSPGWWLVLATIATPSALYLWRVSITPDQVWAMRRLLPVTLPGLAVAAAVALAALWGLRRWWTRTVAVLLTCVVAVMPLLTWENIFRVAEQGGRLAEARAVCDALGSDHVVSVRAGGPPYLATLLTVCGVDAVEMAGVPSIDQLAEIRAQWGDELSVVAFTDFALPWPDGVAPPATAVTSTTRWSPALSHVPDGSETTESSVWVADVGPAGELLSVPPTG